MTKKRLFLLASLPLTIAVIFGVLAMLPPSPGVTKANFDRIQEGMTKAEVEDIFGRTTWKTEPHWRRSHTNEIWSSDDGEYAVVIVFNERGTAVIGESFDSNEPFLDKIRRWLHLR